MSGRVVMHVDMDAFYASVELRRRPELRGTPVIVGGSPRGVVLSATYEARAYGVRSGMPSAQAHRLAPTATFVNPDFDSYSEVSKAIVEVFNSVSSVVESASIDEAYLDVTGAVRMFGSPTTIGEYVRAVVADEQQITCSVGIGPSKFIAKVASRQAKPDGLIEVSPEQVVGFLHPLPVEAMWGVGRATAERLNRIGVFSVDDLAHTPIPALRRVFGPHLGALLHHLAWGRDGRRVVVSEPERSVGSQETFGRDSDDPAVVREDALPAPGTRRKHVDRRARFGARRRQDARTRPIGPMPRNGIVMRNPPSGMRGQGREERGGKEEERKPDDVHDGRTWVWIAPASRLPPPATARACTQRALAIGTSRA